MQNYRLTVKFSQFYFLTFFHLFFYVHSSLDRCQLSMRDSVYIIIFQVTVEALGLSCDDYPINKSSIQRIRTQMRKDRAESIKSDFHNNLPEVLFSEIENYYKALMREVLKKNACRSLFHLERRSNFLQYQNWTALPAKIKLKQFQRRFMIGTSMIRYKSCAVIR